jgi:hypothetical protein
MVLLDCTNEASSMNKEGLEGIELSVGDGLYPEIEDLQII